MRTPLTSEFYNRSPLEVARELLGKKLVRTCRGVVLSGMIVETEAYLGTDDTGSHAHRGKTPRNAVMFGTAGHAYVYLVYGMHHMLNVVAGNEGTPWAVLIRALVPIDGKEAMRRWTGKSANPAHGPGKLCRAMRIDRKLNGWDLTAGDRLWIEDYTDIPDNRVRRTKRIGIDYAREEHREALWRFVVTGEQELGQVPGPFTGTGRSRRWSTMQ